jgi:DNA-binding transcriptional ArsR family regulator
MSERIIRRGGGIVLLLAGLSLELYYNASRFSAEGAPRLIAWASAVVVVVLLNVAFLERQRGAGFLVLAIGVGFFSVVSTSASQSWTYSAVKAQGTAAAVRQEGARLNIETIKSDLTRLDAESEALTRQRGTAGDVSEAARWRSTLAGIDARADEIEKRRDTDLERLKAATGTLADSAQTNKETAYSYYHGLLGINADGLQVVFHMLLSLLLTLSAPMGILALSFREPQEAETEEAKPRHSAKSATLSPERRAILDLLRETPKPMRTGAVAAAIGKTFSTASEHLGNLARAGLVASPRFGFWEVSESTQGSNAQALPSEITGGEGTANKGSA